MDTPPPRPTEVHVAQANDYFAWYGRNLYLLYAPTTDLAQVACEDELRAMIGESMGQPDGIVVFADLLAGAPIRIDDSIPEGTCDLNAAMVVLNNKCNLSCRYCYSAGARHSKEVSEEEIVYHIDEMFKRCLDQGSSFNLAFGGGGEPFMSLGVLQSGIDRGIALAETHGTAFEVHITTNTTLITETFIEKYKSIPLTIHCSFDIDEAAHNQQRGQFDKVRGNLKKLLDAGIRVEFHSTVTPANVSKQEAMVDTIAREYSRVKTVVFNEVVDMGMFASALEYRQFWTSYLANFFRARKAARKMGFRLESSKTRTMSHFRTNSCRGGLLLCPEKAISICPMVSSADSPLFEKYRIGVMEADGRPLVDEEKYRAWQSRNVDTDDRCARCMARYRCGGGCQFVRDTYSPQMLNEYCSLIKHICKFMILERIEETLFEGDGSVLSDMVTGASRDR